MTHLRPPETRLCLAALPSRERAVVTHLLECPDCRDALAAEGAAAGWSLEPEPVAAHSPAPAGTGGGDPFDAMLDRIKRFAERHQAAAAEERRRADRLLGAFRTVPPRAWAAFLARPLPAVFFPLLLDHAFRQIETAPNRAERIARRLRHAVRRRSRTELPAILREEVMIRTWTLQGAACARRREWSRADRAFDRASRLLDATPNTGAEAELCRRLASRFRARRRTAEALALRARAAVLAEALGELEEEIADLADRAEWLLERDPGRAAGLLAAALLRTEGDGLRPLAGPLRERLAEALLLLGRPTDAAAVSKREGDAREARPRTPGSVRFDLPFLPEELAP
jgi:hypothetical protein